MSQEPLVRDAEVADFRAAVLAKLTYAVGKDPDHAFDHDWFEAIALAARDHMVEHWMDHTRQIYRKGQKRVYYLSLEFLIGRLLYDSLSNLGLLDIAREALTDLGVDLERIRLLEPDAALGNGGLGRLAACFMESMSTLGVAAMASATNTVCSVKPSSMAGSRNRPKTGSISATPGSSSVPR
jgi:starch phosphorylase